MAPEHACYPLAVERRRHWLITALFSPRSEIPDGIGGYRTLSSPSNAGQASRYKLDFRRRSLLSVVDPP